MGIGFFKFPTVPRVCVSVGLEHINYHPQKQVNTAITLTWSLSTPGKDVHEIKSAVVDDEF